MPDVFTVRQGDHLGVRADGRGAGRGDRIAEPLYEDGRMLLHGITFGGHPVAAAVALRNIEIFEREGVLENVREHEGLPGRAVGRTCAGACRSWGTWRGAGYFWALELVRDGGRAPGSAPRSASGCCAASWWGGSWTRG